MNKTLDDELQYPAEFGELDRRVLSFLVVTRSRHAAVATINKQMIAWIMRCFVDCGPAFVWKISAKRSQHGDPRANGRHGEVSTVEGTVEEKRTGTQGCNRS